MDFVPHPFPLTLIPTEFEQRSIPNRDDQLLPSISMMADGSFICFCFFADGSARYIDPQIQGRRKSVDAESNIART